MWLGPPQLKIKMTALARAVGADERAAARAPRESIQLHQQQPAPRKARRLASRGDATEICGTEFKSWSSWRFMHVSLRSRAASRVRHNVGNPIAGTTWAED
jgi:hypothetical protein